MKSQHQERVERFLIGAGHEIPAKPQRPDNALKLPLQATLLHEELAETVKAMGLRIRVSKGDQSFWLDEGTFQIFIEKDVDLVELADGLADLSVVTIGTMSLCGIHDLPILAEVDGNNLLKLAKGTHRKDGKFVKAADHPKPAIGRALSGQDGNEKDVYLQAFKAELFLLLQHERFNRVNADSIWATAMMGQRLGATPHEAAQALFREILGQDMKQLAAAADAEAWDDIE